MVFDTTLFLFATGSSLGLLFDFVSIFLVLCFFDYPKCECQLHAGFENYSCICVCTHTYNITDLTRYIIKIFKNFLILYFLKQNINKLFSVKIYRFTNLFGKWAKPNFNSVIATFSHLISRNKKIKLSKVNENIEFLHIDYVMELFEKDIKKKPIKNFELINKFDKTYKIKLHDLAAMNKSRVC